MYVIVHAPNNHNNLEVASYHGIYLYVGSTVSFTNPSGLLIFSEESTQSINLTRTNNSILEVCV